MTFKCMVVVLVIVQALAVQSNQGRSTTSACSAVAESCDTMIMKLESVRTMFDEKGDVGDCVCPEATPVDCAEIKRRDPKATSGVYYIKPRGYHSQFRVYCNMFTDGGGWTVFQRRVDGSVEFNTTWQNYKNGFGTSTGEYWLGNDYLHYLTRQGLYMLRIDMEDWHDVKTYAKYSNFNIQGEGDNYRVDFGMYLSGTASDRLSYHKTQRFSTFDQDNDGSGTNCAALHSGGWWFKNCDECNLNGKYYHSNRYTAERDIGIEWKSGSYTTKTFYSLKSTEMKVRPMYY